MKIIETRKFIKSRKKLSKKLQIKLIEKIKIFKEDHFHPLLNNHWLAWNYNWLRSINITWDYRLIFRELSDWTYELVELIDIWSHSFLY